VVGEKNDANKFRQNTNSSISMLSLVRLLISTLQPGCPRTSQKKCTLQNHRSEGFQSML
jgi:hypothetical protein